METKKAWWKEAVIYQIYPRSFMDSNGDGIGDLNGITSKLDYLSELGIDVIWLSPVYESPNDDNGYDISNYQAIMREFGSMADFDHLLVQAHKRNIKIVMDLVVNHTSDEHKWFVESRKSEDNPYRNFYIWRDGKEDGSVPNNWGSCFSGSAWEFDEQTKMYYLHLFSKKQPDLNWDNPKVRNEVFSMMNWWCEKGIDGFRMDVISMISKDSNFPDGDIKGGLYGDYSPYAVHGPHVHEYLKEMNEKVLSKYNIMTVGETAGVTIEEARKYAGVNSHELNMVFQFEHVEGTGKYGKWTDEKEELCSLKAVLSKWQTELYEVAWNSLFWNNHDQPRTVSRFGDDSPVYRDLSAKMLATCLHMMQGTPYIYQGEELGMTNYPFENISQFKDIESINAYNELVNTGIVKHEQMMKFLRFKGRDNARTPVQWNKEENAGFTSGTPWIAVNPNYKEINAESQLSNKNSVFHYYKKLIALRKQYEIIVYGDYKLFMEDSKEIFAYERNFENQTLYILNNFTNKNVKAFIPEKMKEKEANYLITNYNDCNIKETEILRPYEAVVIMRLN
jgi:oligo-1,6-glucosidase